MRLVIIDDEITIIEGLKKLIDWKSYHYDICATATSGQEGYEKILEYNPELVITDLMMPGISGIALIKKLRGAGYNGRIIILSGYNDFKFAQEALRYEVSYYLLKPIDEDELIAILNEINEKNKNEYSFRLGMNLSDSEKMYILLEKMLSGSIECSLHRVNMYRINTDVSEFQLVLLQPVQKAKTITEALFELRKEYETTSRLIVLIDDIIVMLMLGDASIRYFYQRFIGSNTRGDLLHSEENFIVFGEVTNQFHLLARQFKEYKKIISRKFFYKEDRIFIEATNLHMKQQEVMNDDYNLIESITTIFHRLIENKTEAMTSEIDNLFSHIRYKDISSEQAIQVVCNVIIQINHLFSDSVYDVVQGLSITEIIQKICGCLTLYEMNQLINVELLKISEKIRVKTNQSVMEQVLNYITLNYNQDLKLENVASKYNYNASYLGKAFHEYTGEYFNSYLEKIRLEKAKGLLKNHSLSNNEIAIRVGYKNIEYFYRKFKNYTGKSPNQYRSEVRT